jgi:hypothetical protein
MLSTFGKVLAQRTQLQPTSLRSSAVGQVGQANRDWLILTSRFRRRAAAQKSYDARVPAPPTAQSPMPRRLPRPSVLCSALACLGCDATLDPVGAALSDAPSSFTIEAEDYTALDARDEASNFVVVDTEHEASADDPDASHLAGASGGSYLEALPDTFTEETEATAGVDFFRQPGAGCTLTYRVDFGREGRYFVWLRAYAGGGKDNTAFIGIDGAWNPVPAQVCGAAGWDWTSALRDEAAGGTCSETERAWLDVEAAGPHNVQVSLREDGFELDQLFLTLDPDVAPEP